MYWVRTHGNTSDLSIGQVTKRKVFQEFFFSIRSSINIVSSCCIEFCRSNKLFYPTFKTEIDQLSHHIF